VYLKFFLLALAAAFVLGTSGIEAQQAFADVIDFEPGLVVVGAANSPVDLQPVGVVVTATNTVTFGVGSCTSPTSAFIAKTGFPTSAYTPRDQFPAAASGGTFFLTDETAGPDTTLDYCISFANPVNNLSLDLYDYRNDGGPSVGDIATLRVFSDAFVTEIGSATFRIPFGTPDPNFANLSIQSPTGLISSAQLSFNQPDIGTGIDNITFTTQPELVADLGLAKIVSNATPTKGDSITFTVTLTNNGPSAAEIRSLGLSLGIDRVATFGSTGFGDGIVNVAEPTGVPNASEKTVNVAIPPTRLPPSPR